MKRLLFILLAMFALVSCGQEEPLIVYCEPQWEPKAQEWLAAFRQNHGVETQLIVLSSEVAAQHIRYHQPIDVWIHADAGLPKRFDIEGSLVNTRTLAEDSVVKVRCLETNMASPFKSADCWVKAASDTPLELFTTQWLAHLENGRRDSCVIVANFHSQLSDYLLHGWVGGGYVWASFAAEHPEQLEVLEKGPGIPDAWLVSQVGTGRNPEAAKAFLEEMKSQ
jgi:spermidine/putrescine-binding protein